ncbi:MAG: SWIM zinc finger family protein, partial [Actinomycetota bacterium]|nr:SWIM zinc finger family protein [Actinomycetota bacterium]
MAATRWSVKQVLDHAPDARSGRAAQALASPGTWSDLGSTDSLVWGKCQGTGPAPYQVSVDLTEPAFRCTCPSRKLPCKHGLALLLLWVEHGDAVGHVAQPAGFAEEWAEQRQAAARRRSRSSSSRDTITDPAAQARRQAEREATMSAGLDEFERWLGDLLRQGLAAARRQPYSFWDAAAARLVDAQMPALAERVRD